MSRIEKLGIQGIRSFGPDDMRRIEFYSPLTLILGQNGCGKTTIIESLKFITTGEMPPGCGKGAAFIHDPKMAKDTVVRGQVKLRFRGTKGKSVTACRSVDVTQKAKNLVFNSLDSTITYDGPDGKQTSISNKCIDFHTEVTSLLGVAKPILDNVIFCHQEDSNWPLDEGKKVKEKFDAIFNATKYIKCLDAFRKLRKEKKLAVNGMQDTLTALKQCKEQVVNRRKVLQDTLRKREEVKELQDQLVKEQGPIRKRITEMEAVENDIWDIKKQINDNESRLRSIIEYQDELKATRTEKFDCSDLELQGRIQDFERNTRVKEEEQREIKSNLVQTTERTKSVKKEEAKALLLMGKLEAAQNQHGDRLKRLDTLLQDLVAKYGIDGYAGRTDFGAEESKDILTRMKSFQDTEKANLNATKEEFEQREALMQREIQKLMSEEAGLVREIENFSKQVTEKARSLRSEQVKLTEYEDQLSSANIDDLRKSIEEIEAKIQDERERVDVAQLTQEMNSKGVEREGVEREVDDVKRKVAKLNRLSVARSQYDIHVKDRQALTQRNDIIKRKNNDDFQSIFSGPVGNNVRNELEAQLANIRRQVADIGETKRALEKRKTENAMKIRSETRDIVKLEAEIRDFQSKFEEVCIAGDLEEAIRRCKEQIDALLRTKGDQDSSTVMFRTFLDKICGGEGCPLCHRNFEAGYERQMLVDEIESKLTRLPHEMTQLMRSLREKESLHERLLQLRPQKERADTAEAELAARKLALQSQKDERERVEQELDNCSSQEVFMRSEEETCVRVQPDVLALDANLKDIRRLDDSIANVQATLGAQDDDLSMEDLMKLQTDMEQKVKRLRKEGESIREEKMEHEAKLQRFNHRKIELSTRELDLRMKQQDMEKTKEAVEKLKAEKGEMERKIDASQAAVAPIKYQLNERMAAKEVVTREKHAFDDAARTQLESIRDEIRQASDVYRNVRLYIDRGDEESLSEGRTRLADLQRQGKEGETSRERLQDQVTVIDKELTKRRETKRSLDDERKIREKEVEAQKMKRTISALQERAKDFDVQKMETEKKRLLRDYDRIGKEKSRLEGKLEELSDKQAEEEKHLRTKDMKNAEKNYKEKFIEIKCLQLACDDINKYYMALDTAVMKFHHEKMSAINAIIRELWRTTYKGNDIDHIEIKTDDVESQGTDKRKTYHYRVIMVKNQIEMDMRARCSSGQKVLASLIIRMALAETFSANCGILALDEPTTNLDRANIEALSLALLNIVNKRSHQKNFQLIVITHDEEFLERMSRADFIQFYHRVSRDERGLSIITKKSAQMFD